MENMTTSRNLAELRNDLFFGEFARLLKRETRSILEHKKGGALNVFSDGSTYELDIKEHAANLMGGT